MVISDIEKAKLYNKLKKDNFIISIDEFDKILKIYDHLTNYLNKIFWRDFDFRYDFISNSDDYSLEYYKLFKQVIFMYQNGLLKYIDYILISNALGEYRYTAEREDYIAYCRSFLKEIINKYISHKEELIFSYYYAESCPIDNVADSPFNDILENELVSPKYQEVFKMFKNIYDDSILLKDEFKEYYDGKKNFIYFETFINCVYYYFLDNNILNNDLDRAYKFLEYIHNDIFYILEKINSIGIRYTIDLFYYIDCLYKSFDTNVKIIK